MPDWYFHFVSPHILFLFHIYAEGLIIALAQPPHWCIFIRRTPFYSAALWPLGSGLLQVECDWSFRLHPPHPLTVKTGTSRQDQSILHVSPKVVRAPPTLLFLSSAFLSRTWHSVTLLSASSTMSKVLIFNPWDNFPSSQKYTQAAFLNARLEYHTHPIPQMLRLYLTVGFVHLSDVEMIASFMYF